MQNDCFTSLKRLIAIIGVAAAMFFFFACGGNGDDNDDDYGDGQNQTSPPQGLYEKYPVDGVVVWSDFSAVMSATVAYPGSHGAERWCKAPLAR